MEGSSGLGASSGDGDVAAERAVGEAGAERMFVAVALRCGVDWVAGGTSMGCLEAASSISTSAWKEGGSNVVVWVSWGVIGMLGPWW